MRSVRGNTTDGHNLCSRFSGARLLSNLLSGAIAISLIGCAHVPKEAVELSYQIGQDLPRLHESYDNLIHDRYEDFRARRNAYVDEVWTPEFLSHWIQKGRLVDVARGQTVWSFEAKSFVAPTPGKEDVQLLATVREWSDQAISQVERKRRALLDPLDQEEKEIRKQVAEAFSRVIQGNAYVTAHLASIRHVQDAEDGALQALRIKDLRDSIDSTLIGASNKAAAGLDIVRKADGLVDKAADASHMR